MDAPGGLIVAGMGGSAAGARLAIAALGRAADAAAGRSPTATRCPAGPGPETLVLCSSYSGATEETLAAYDDAVERGAPRLVVSTGGPLVERARRDGVPVIPIPGGFQPRAAIGYSFVAALEAAALAGAAPSVRDEIEAAAELAETLAAEWGPDGDGEAKDIARALHGTVPVIAGAELAAAAAYRWKCQFNENAALPAFARCCPRPTTTRSSAGPRRATSGRFSYVSLEDAEAHPRNALRAELTAEVAAAGADPVLRLRRARGVAGRAARVARPARRPRVDLRRRPARRRSRRHPRDRLAESGAGAALVWRPCPPPLPRPPSPRSSAARLAATLPAAA